VRFIKAPRLRWLGHVQRMDNKLMPKQILYDQPFGTRRKGRPRKRWIDDVEEDLQTLGVRNWRKKAKRRDEWRQVTREAKAHWGCRALEVSK